MLSSRLNGLFFRHRSIRFRLTALFVAILGITLIGFSAVLYGAFIRTQGEEFDAALYNHAIDVAESIRINIFGELSISSDILSTNEKIFPFSVGRAFLQLATPDGRVIVRSRALGEGQLPIYEDDLKQAQKHTAVFRTLKYSEVPSTATRAHSSYRLLSYLVRDFRKPEFLLQIAVPVTLLEQETRNLLLFLMIGIPFTLVLATFGGLYLSGRALAPVSSIIEKAKGISAQNLSARVPIPPADDEMRSLSMTLNDLLDRLHKAFESQERFVSDASHELKTPLAILRGELDLMRSRERSPDEVAGFLASASQELDQLSRLVEDLLLLARVDAGAGSISKQPIRLDEIALEAMSRMEKLASASKVKIKFDLEESDFSAMGDPNLLQSVLQNLIENAIKFSPAGGVVEVTLRRQGDWIYVTVADQGPGISQEAIPHIFDRFYRAKATKEKTPGVGLGLAIVSRITEAHGAKIEVESQPGQGSRFRFGIRKF